METSGTVHPHGDVDSNHSRSRMVAWLQNVWFHRVLVLIGVVLAPAGLFVKQALFNPETPFLVPLAVADWALHPDQQFFPAVPREPGYDKDAAKEVLIQPMRFTQRWVIERIPESFVMRARALKAMTVTVNGIEVQPSQDGNNWKNLASYDLTPALRVGENEIGILVTHEKGIAGLQVVAPEMLRTNGQWLGSIGPGFEVDLPVVSPGQLPPHPGKLQELLLWGWGKWLAGAWLLFTAGLGGWVAVRQCRGEGPLLVREPMQIPRWLRIAAPAIILAIAGWQHLSNAYHFRFHLGPDGEGHAEHIQLVAGSWTPRLATDGWQAYQPPLYYFLAAAAYKLVGGDDHFEAAIKAAQLVGCATGLGVVIVAWLLARRYAPDDPPAQWLVAGLAAFLPLTLTTNLQLSNQPLSAAVEAAAMLAMLVWATRERLELGRYAVLGGVVGVALLSRFSGVITLGLGGLVLGFRALASSRWREWLGIAVYLGAAGLVSGWYYGRNVAVFGDPFYGNWQAFPIVQYPTYRSLGYFVDFGSVFFHSPARGKYISWFDGTYAGLWADGTMTFFAYWMTVANFAQSLMLLLAAWPTVVILIGMVRVWTSALRRPALNGDLLLMAAPWWTVWSLWIFCLKIPATGGGSPRYLLALVPILGLYLIRGRDSLQRHMPWARWGLDVILVLLLIVSITIYRFGRFAA